MWVGGTIYTQTLVVGKLEMGIVNHKLACTGCAHALRVEPVRAVCDIIAVGNGWHLKLLSIHQMRNVSI